HGTIHYISFAQSVESMIREGLKSDAAGSQLVLDPSDAQGILRGLTQEVERHAELNVMPVVLSAPAIRGAVRRLIERVLPQVAVLSPNELTEQSKLRRLATVGLAEA
ncbi:MAG TPA: EscV/YscV/HrcV family type III secretion system export apparatus protein, partial [Deltaproteobacteria bacterium]|nr:EscV/YscV/HrcV family type III secretion system export apparatus protein [Deltaproteobacteria bacterium]